MMLSQRDHRGKAFTLGTDPAAEVAADQRTQQADAELTAIADELTEIRRARATVEPDDAAAR